MNDAPSHLVLVTSTRVPYLRDIIDLMFLQSGSGYRFRYSRKYVQPKLFQDPRMLVGRRGYVVHANTSQSVQGPDTIHEFLPVREVTIRDVKLFGEFIWVYFQVGNWIVFSEQNEVPNEYHQVVLNSTPLQSQKLLSLTLYEASGLNLSTIADDPSVSPEQVTENWIRIANHMARFPDHKSRKPTYLKLIAVRTKDCANPVLPKAFSETESGYEFRSDKDYRMEIFQYNEYGVPAEPFSLKLEVDRDRIIPLADEATILGRYDFLTLHFRPSATLRSYGTILGVQVDTKNDMKLSVRLHARILRGLGQIVGSIAVAGSIGLASLAPGLASGTTTNISYFIAGMTALVGFIGFYYWGRTKG